MRCRTFYEQHIHQEHLPLPKGVPAQCRVGQTVTARHPKLRTIHDGDVLTAGVNTYMVQFHRPDLGVAKVPDTDVALAHTPTLVSGEAGSVGAAEGTSSRGGPAPASTAKVRMICCRFMMVMCCSLACTIASYCCSWC